MEIGKTVKIHENEPEPPIKVAPFVPVKSPQREVEKEKVPVLVPSKGG